MRTDPVARRRFGDRVLRRAVTRATGSRHATGEETGLDFDVGRRAAAIRACHAYFAAWQAPSPEER